MKQLLNELEGILVQIKNPVLSDLNNSGDFDINQFETAMKNLHLVVPSELHDLYRWKTGIQTEKALNPKYDYQTFSFGNHIDYNATVSLYILDQQTSKICGNRFLPIIYYGILEDPILIDLSEKSGTFGQLYYYSPSITFSPKPIPIYVSLTAWVKTIIDCYKEGVYLIDKNGTLVINDGESEIAKRYNKNIDFWDR